MQYKIEIRENYPYTDRLIELEPLESVLKIAIAEAERQLEMRYPGQWRRNFAESMGMYQWVPISRLDGGSVCMAHLAEKPSDEEKRLARIAHLEREIPKLQSELRQLKGKQ